MIAFPEQRCYTVSRKTTEPRCSFVKHKPLPLRLLRSVTGLSTFSFGIYLTMQASIGLAPWDVLVTGLTNHLPMIYGTVALLLSLSILAVDLLMGEKLGLGTIIDALIVGKVVDLFVWLDWIPVSESLWLSILLLLLGIVAMSAGQWLHISTALGCGPRDALLVGLGKRFPRLPIGAVNAGLLVIVFTIGWLLGGQVGIGTVISVICTGPIMQLVFNLVKFEPRDVEHETILETLHIKTKKETVR